MLNGLSNLRAETETGVVLCMLAKSYFLQEVWLLSALIWIPFGKTITFVLSTVGLQRNLDIDGQSKCLKGKDKNE